VVDNIEKMKQKREERRSKMEEMKQAKADREAENQLLGKVVDVDFELMIEKNRLKEGLLQEHVEATAVKLCVCVRKRPIFKKETVAGEIDALSCSNPMIRVHEPKLKVDGITKYVENHTFTFDNTFNEKEDTIDIYDVSLKPLLDRLFKYLSVIMDQLGRSDVFRLWADGVR
jgi:kinesin family protein 2/24